ncbi:hypothetical protein ACFQE6_19045, partial [Natrinema soli]
SNQPSRFPFRACVDVEAALEREGRLTARFDDGVRPFYERLGFSIEPIDEQRHSGVVVATDRV